MRAIDLFCGAGGSSIGAQSLGVMVVAGFDMWEIARETYKDNFPNAKIFGGRLENRSLRRLKKVLGKIDLIMASPECTNHTVAKGARRRSENSRATAFQVCRFARAFQPRWVVVENVVEMRRWKQYSKWLSRIQNMGYHTREIIINAKKFGVPQTRKRLFVLCDRQQPPGIPSDSERDLRTVESILEKNHYKFTPLQKKGRAAATLKRARTAIKAVGNKESFLLVYYGTDGAGGWQPLTRPLRTITTIDRFAYVRPTKEGHEMRMLQVPELRRAMGFPSDFKLNVGTRRERVKLMGNAVCPPVMAGLLKTLTESRDGRAGPAVENS